MRNTPPNGSLFYRAFLALGQPLAVLDSSGVVQEANQAFLRLFSQEPTNVYGKPLASLCTSADPNAPAVGCCWQGELLWSAQDEAVIRVVAELQPLNGESGELMGSLLIVHQVRNEAAAAQGGQIQQMKLESLGVLASSVAHDLNNILTGVLGHVSYLRLSLPNDLAHRDSIVAIEDGARRAASITQQILEFARGRELELSTANFTLVVAAALNLLRGSLPQNVRVRFKADKEDIFVYGDEGQLSQLVLNLAVNAQEAISQSGTVEITLQKSGLPVHLREQNPHLTGHEFAKLAVRDDGDGIPEELREKIFEPFFTTKSEHGTGLGLATVYSIVKAHQGAIDVDSAVGKGTVFEVFLPLSSGADYREPRQEGEELPTGSERILVVDDEEAVRTVIQRSLEHLGYEVVIAGNGREALECFQKNGGEFSLVILDMIMPQMPGDELFFKLRDLDSTTPVLIASGYSSDGRTRAVLENGALGYIQKPFAVEELAQEVRRCIDLGKAARSG